MPTTHPLRRSVGRQTATPPRAHPARAAAESLKKLPSASTQATASQPDPVIEQAKRDIDAGQVDTDMRATPGLDADRRKKLVPGPGGKPPKSGA